LNNRERILDAARTLFNVRGIPDVSLREVAAAAGVSFGNLTYHFKSREDLVRPLYYAMMEAHRDVSAAFGNAPNLLRAFLDAPAQTFEISVHYRFLFTAYADIKRTMPALYAESEQHRKLAMQRFLPLFSALQRDGWLRPELSEPDFHFLMEASSLLRTHFFALSYNENDGLVQQKKQYVAFVNRLLFPYLTAKGIQEFQQFGPETT
jgi:AcrR family transcriptional regulator